VYKEIPLIECLVHRLAAEKWHFGVEEMMFSLSAVGSHLSISDSIVQVEQF
jgi:hypothetical protein